MKKLDSRYVWLLIFQSFFGTIVFSFVLISAYWAVKITSSQADNQDLQGINRILDIFGNWWFLLVVLFSINAIRAVLTYYFYRYELREEGFRKEHGVIWKKYVTIPYERIQNVDIYRGVFARIFGLSDLNIQTAGMSTTVSSYGGSAEGRLPGLSKEVAEQVRDELIRRAKHGSSQQAV